MGGGGIYEIRSGQKDRKEGDRVVSGDVNALRWFDVKTRSVQWKIEGLSNIHHPEHPGFPD